MGRQSSWSLSCKSTITAASIHTSHLLSIQGIYERDNADDDDERQNCGKMRDSDCSMHETRLCLMVTDGHDDIDDDDDVFDDNDDYDNDIYDDGDYYYKALCKRS